MSLSQAIFMYKNTKRVRPNIIVRDKGSQILRYQLHVIGRENIGAAVSTEKGECIFLSTLETHNNTAPNVITVHAR